MNKLGVYFAYWTRDWQADFEHYVKRVAKLGFDVLEVSTAYMLDQSKEKLRELKKTAEAENIELTYCIGFPKDKDMSSEDPFIRRNAVEYAKRTLEMIHLMGGQIFGGINYAAWPGDPGVGLVDKRPYLERSIHCMQVVAKTAEDYNITYCLEIVNRFEQFLMNTAEEGVQFAREVNSPNVKLLLDSFHLNIEEDSIQDAIKFAGNHIGHFHIGECNRKVPGQGHMPWDEICKAIRDANYNGRIVMEPFTKMGGQVGRDIKVWRDLSGNADNSKMDADLKSSLEFIREKLNKAGIS